jgi:hypothetical protein
MAPVPGRAFLARVIARVHAAAQETRTREEYELTSITLRLLGLLRQGRAATLDLACGAAFSMHFAKWQQRVAARSEAMAADYQRLIPDFDPAEAKHAAMVKERSVRRPEPFSGNLYEMPQEEVAAESKPLRRLSAKAADRQSKTAG